MRTITGVKVNVNIEIILQRRKLTISMFLYQEDQVMGNSYLFNTIFQTLTRTLSFYSGTPEKAKVLKVTATGVAGVYINGATTNTALGIAKTRGNDILKLSDKMRCNLRLMHSELEAMAIDEISMVSNIRQYQIHCRLCEIFNFSLDISFAVLTVASLGDLY